MSESSVNVSFEVDAAQFQAGIRLVMIQTLIAGGMDPGEAERQVDEQIVVSKAKTITEEGAPWSA